jgi:Exostosin family
MAGALSEGGEHGNGSVPLSPSSSTTPRNGGGGGKGSRRFLVVAIVMIGVGVYTLMDDQSLLSTYRTNLPTKDYAPPRTAINNKTNAAASFLATQAFLSPPAFANSQQAESALDLLVEEEAWEEDENDHGDNHGSVSATVPLQQSLQTLPASGGGTPTATNKNGDSRDFKFYILRVPMITSALIANETEKFKTVYQNELNEASAEVWLHRGMASLTYQQGQTMDPNEADAFIIPAYLWARIGMQDKSERSDLYQEIIKEIVDKSKPHIWLSPSPNPNLSGSLGLRSIVNQLLKSNVNMYSIGFERNSYWQVVSTDRIIPVPYVLHPPPLETLVAAFDHDRIENFVFFRADRRRMAKGWAGCDRAIVAPLFGRTDMDIGLSGKKAPPGGGGRLSQEQYNHRMSTSDYCLVMCGDTPTTRSLISAVTAGCIPILIGRWWHGYCDPPCHKGWGWNIAERPHLPFADQINWDLVPVVNHTQFQMDPNATLMALFQQYPKERKDQIRAEMKRVQKWLVYGWGDPADSTVFGDAYPHIWQSIIHFTGLERESNSSNITAPKIPG